MRTLDETQRRYLRGLAHSRKPVVMIGDKGLTDAVVAELEAALDRHELVKVRIRAGERSDRDRIVAGLCERTGAALVQRIGHTASLYRRHPEKPRIPLPRH